MEHANRSESAIVLGFAVISAVFLLWLWINPPMHRSAPVASAYTSCLMSIHASDEVPPDWNSWPSPASRACHDHASEWFTPEGRPLVTDDVLAASVARLLST